MVRGEHVKFPDNLADSNEVSAQPQRDGIVYPVTTAAEVNVRPNPRA
jgi:hypothetical protein